MPSISPPTPGSSCPGLIHCRAPDPGSLCLFLQFASDPRCDTVYRKYLYVLATREQPGVVGSTGSRTCDCVEVYLQSSGQRVFKMTFHHSMSFKQIVLVGQETQRALLLLTGEAGSRGLQIVCCRFPRTCCRGWGGRPLTQESVCHLVLDSDQGTLLLFFSWSKSLHRVS